MAFLTGCATARPTVEVRTVVPELDFPAFPVLEGGEASGDGNVTAPESYFRDLLAFRVMYEALAEAYGRYRELYGESRW